MFVEKGERQWFGEGGHHDVVREGVKGSGVVGWCNKCEKKGCSSSWGKEEDERFGDGGGGGNERPFTVWVGVRAVGVCLSLQFPKGQ